MTGQQHEAAGVMEHGDYTPVPVSGRVTLDGAIKTTEEAADFGTYFHLTFQGGEQKVVLLQQDNNRVRAVITVDGTGPVYIGTEAQCAAVAAGNLAGSGMALFTGRQLEIRHREVVWIIPTQTAIPNTTVGVTVERRRTS